LFSTFIFIKIGKYWRYLAFFYFPLFLIVEIYSLLLNRFILIKKSGNDSNLLVMIYRQIVSDNFVM